MASSKSGDILQAAPSMPFIHVFIGAASEVMTVKPASNNAT